MTWQPTVRPPCGTTPQSSLDTSCMGSETGAGQVAKEALLGMDEAGEEHPARIKPSPMKPSNEEVARHEATHCPYRNWCPACVAASAKEDAHPRRRCKDDEVGHPRISMDYELLEKKITVLVVKDETSGAVLAYDSLMKGAGDDLVVSQLVRDLEDWGRHDIRLQTDGEPAMLALQQAIADARKGATIQRNSPAYNPQSNGGAEKAVQDVTDLMRRLLLGLEAKLQGRLDLSFPWARWLIRHAAFVLTRYQVGHDGQTPWRRLTGKEWTGYAFNFGERVMGRLALKKPSTDRKEKRGKKKLAARSLPGVYVGVYPRTGEHIIALETGEAIRVRTVHRLAEADRWSMAAVMSVKALPRRANPNTEEREPATRQPQERFGQEDDRADGANLGPVDTRETIAFPREMRITSRLLDK